MPLKFISRFLLVVMLTVTLNCMHESAHALQLSVTAAGGQAADLDIAASHHSPCSPLEQHPDHDDGDNCCNCVCHTPLTIQAFQLSYNPFILELNTYDLFTHIPEVYLPKFIPPQIPA